jgi:hypothetical protein
MDYKEGALSKKKDEKKSGDSGHKPAARRSEPGSAEKKHHPHVHIHSHDAGHTMHVMHQDGSHEMHHFAPGDTAGMQEILQAHLGGGAGGGAAEPEQHVAEGASPQQEQQEQAQAA